MEKNDTIYVVQGRSGMVFMATLNYEEAKTMRDKISDGQIMHFIDGKHIFTN